jgi:two-component system, cell cycle sensor histidine kinase and response regulator CckA
VSKPTATGGNRPPITAPGAEDDLLSPEAGRRALHDLRVHQIELELQNDELRKTQHELEASRARYVDLYDKAPVGYLTLDATGQILEANLTAASLLAIARDLLVRQPFTRFILPEDQDIYYRHRQQLAGPGLRHVCELGILRGDDTPLWVRLEATTTTDEFGTLVCRCVMSDITAHRRVEETLRASELRHRILFENSHDALMTLAPPAWRFTSGNAMTLQLFGLADEASFLSHAPSEYWPVLQPDGRASAEKAAAMIDAAMCAGAHLYDWTFRRLSGREFPATVLLTRIELEGTPLLQATVRDETELKQLHAMLSQQDRLSSMGMLAAGVAHEINNPLAYVLHNVETLGQQLPRLTGAVERGFAALRAVLPDDALAKLVGEDAELLEPAALKEIVERAREASDGIERIRIISKAIGTFSRVESTECSRVDLNYAIECATVMALNDIKFRARFATEFGVLPSVWASEGKLSQVFLNLLINAAQAIGEGDVQNNLIQVRTWCEGEHAFAEVKDTGKGIAPENLDRVFEPFFTTKPIGVGSGLGLAICRSIIGEFGGDIRVESELGVGTRFVVRLAVSEGVSDVPRSAPISEQPNLPCVRGRVLVVDDEETLRGVLVRMLKAEHDLVTAASGEAAQSIIELDQDFDVILCDLMMPDMTGMELHEWLLANHPVLAKRVVFLSGGAFTGKASAYVTSSGNLRLEKPYESAKLKRLVAELVAACHREGLEEGTAMPPRSNAANSSGGTGLLK